MTATAKTAGCCSKCDKRVFEVVRRDPKTDVPLQLGPAKDAMRITFILVNGSRMDLTFCEDCASSLTSGEFPFLWKRVMRSWIEESGPDHPTVKHNVDNGILGIFGMKHWKEIAA